MHPYVQKSRRTILPFKAANDSGLSVFNQPRPPVISGARTRTLFCTDIERPFKPFGEDGGVTRLRIKLKKTAKKIRRKFLPPTISRTEGISTFHQKHLDFGWLRPVAALLVSQNLIRKRLVTPKSNCTAGWSIKGKGESNKAVPGDRTPKQAHHLFVRDCRCNLNL